MTTSQLPQLKGPALWNMSLGFLGIQCAFGLQNANASRILQTFGADVHHLTWFWLAAPLTGMLVQPLVGHYSDRTWTRLGRRRPYFLAGAIFSAIALCLLPQAGLFAAFLPPLIVGALFLVLMDASINVSMEPFRALVADLLPSAQRTAGFAIQTFLIGVGAVIGSWLPYVLTNLVGFDSVSQDDGVPANVTWSFIFGAMLLLATITWTVLRTKEHPPEEYQRYHNLSKDQQEQPPSLMSAISKMPRTMRQLGLVQFLSWFGLFSMWVFTTPALATHVWGLDATDTHSQEFSEAGDWGGVLFGVYNLIATLYALALPSIAKRTSRRATHALSLACGGLGLMSMYFIHDKHLLLLSMVGVGIAWASILAMPYAMLAGALPAGQMGIYMGLFNFFITLPQVLNGLFGGLIVEYLYDGSAMMAVCMGGVGFLLAAIATLRVQDES
ncbi:MAG: MFS transporter [Polyangiaceae bacterium]|nr:MFS transporter [Polyangiaceae bacterium]